MDFHRKVYDGYISLAEKYPERIRRIDASVSVEEVFEQVKKELDLLRWENA